MESPERESGELYTSVVPRVVESALRAHIAKNIHVTLYGNFSDYEEMPNEKQSHIKLLPAEGILPPGPFIAMTKLEGINHFWVAVDSPLERIDSDGKAHKELLPVGGYLEIKYANAK